MKTKTTIALLAAGIVSLLALGDAHRADADWRGQPRDFHRNAARTQQSVWSELQRDRAELRRDYAELERDRAELHRLYHSGASRAAIERKKAEIRQDLAEIAQDRRELRDDLGQLRQSRDQYGYGWGNDGWNRNRQVQNDNGWWGWGNDRAGDRHHWGWGYGRD